MGRLAHQIRENGPFRVVRRGYGQICQLLQKRDLGKRSRRGPGEPPNLPITPTSSPEKPEIGDLVAESTHNPIFLMLGSWGYG